MLAGHSLAVSAQSSTGFPARQAFGIERSAAALPSMKVFWTSLLFFLPIRELCRGNKQLNKNTKTQVAGKGSNDLACFQTWGEQIPGPESKHLSISRASIRLWLDQPRLQSQFKDIWEHVGVEGGDAHVAISLDIYPNPTLLAVSRIQVFYKQKSFSPFFYCIYWQFGVFSIA